MECSLIMISKLSMPIWNCPVCHKKFNIKRVFTEFCTIIQYFVFKVFIISFKILNLRIIKS